MKEKQLYKEGDIVSFLVKGKYKCLGIILSVGTFYSLNNKKRIAYKIKKLNNINKDETSLYLRYRIKNCDVLYQNEIIEKIA